MMKISIDISKYDGSRMSRFEDFPKSEQEKELKENEKTIDTSKQAIPRGDEVSEDRMHVSRVNWLGRKEREAPKKDRPIAPGGKVKELDDSEEDEDEDETKNKEKDKEKDKENKPIRTVPMIG